MAECLIALGSNLGDRTAQLDEAIRNISDDPRIAVQRVSDYHETEPIGGPERQTAFLNAAVRAVTGLSPVDLWRRLQRVEQNLGRTRVVRWGPRVIDIDLLLYESLILQTEQLVLPHPRMAVRRFVLHSASEVAPDMIHPPTGLTLRDLLARLDRLPYYVAVAGPHAAASRKLAGIAAERMEVQLLAGPAEPWYPPRGAPPDIALPKALDCLTLQRRLLQTIVSAGPSRRAYVSDFWINQWLAFAAAWSPGTERSRLEQACRNAIAQAPEPHFVLYLDPFPAPSDPGHRAPAAGNAPRLRADAAAHPSSMSPSPSRVPILCVPTVDLESALVELQAGIDAMR